MLYLIVKRYSTDAYYKDTNTHNYLPYGSAQPGSCKKNAAYNLDKGIIIFVIDCEKVKLKLNESTIWTKNNKYPDHVISNAFYNTKLQGAVQKPKITPTIYFLLQPTTKI